MSFLSKLKKLEQEKKTQVSPKDRLAKIRAKAQKNLEDTVALTGKFERSKFNLDDSGEHNKDFPDSIPGMEIEFLEGNTAELTASLITKDLDWTLSDVESRYAIRSEKNEKDKHPDEDDPWKHINTRGRREFGG